MNIGVVARKSGLPAKTIRYYEDIGLVKADRRPNGYRDYSEEHLNTLRFLARARSLGFSIEDCRQLLSLYEDRDRASSDVKTLAISHIREVERKIEDLEGIRATLSSLVEACQGDQRPDCPILFDLAGRG
ncbi:MAG TPA: Cu(I)-responsive transcriptional regulator [Afifellaceae bacterium]|nr:Cu(I)-responsive transcriptional regulator [Afifellaceae bacterium]